VYKYNKAILNKNIWMLNEGVMMATIEKILNNKGNTVWHVSPDVTVYDAIKEMDSKGVGALPVVVNDKLVGIISERDYARKIILNNRSSKETLVKEIMSVKVFHTFPGQKVVECMAVMTEHHIRHLPVVTDGKLTGMISLGDVVKEIISEQQFKIEQLEHTISWEESY
jgi:signal-transduction protein with cAMP-binding, CBS, and nucleotidyltransferase domain